MPKKPIPPIYINLSETFRIDVNMDFANTNHGGFLILPLKCVYAYRACDPLMPLFLNGPALG